VRERHRTRERRGAPEVLTPTTANFGGRELAVNGYLHESCVFGRRRARPQALR